MKHLILTCLAFCSLLAGYATPQTAEQGAIPPTPRPFSEPAAPSQDVGGEVSPLPNTLYQTYYLSSEDPIHSYLQHRRIQQSFNMWLEHYIGEDIRPHWNYDTLAPVQLLDHAFNSIAKPDLALYTCTFSTDDNRCGSIIVSYGIGEEGPYVGKWSLYETTPYQYDLRANSEPITAALSKTDIDLSTASAQRVEWIDTDKNRGDRVILFTDGKGDRYLCYLGGADFTIEKQKVDSAAE